MNILAVPIGKVPDLGRAAEDLHRNFDRPGNEDASLDFPQTYDDLVDSAETVHTILLGSRRLHRPGLSETYVAFADEAAAGDETSPGLHAVGLAFTTMVSDRQGTFTAAGIDPNTPNVSLMIAHPFRGKGIGRLLLRTQLGSIKAQGGGRAWTMARHANAASVGLLTSLGFVKGAEEELYSGPGAYYTYGYKQQAVVLFNEEL